MVATMSEITVALQKRFGFSELEIQRYVQTAPYRYKNYRIPKRSGGFRDISQPSKDLKVIQRYLLETFLEERLVIHEVATAYRKGKNIVDNANFHRENEYLLKQDFKDFFPSIKSTDFEKLLMSKKYCETEMDARVLSLIFFRHSIHANVLSIGSPGSPSISNAIMFDFDEQLNDACQNIDVSYTRYSDDMTFSTKAKGVLFEVPDTVKDILNSIDSPRLEINEEKTVFSSKRFNRHVTGITIANDCSLSIGYRTKRKLRTLVYTADNMTKEELASLNGYLAFVGQVEPNLVKRLKEKYPDQMALIQSTYV
jgi:hypothetical protein